MLNEHNSVIETLKNLEGIQVIQEDSNGDTYIEYIKIIDYRNRQEIKMDFDIYKVVDGEMYLVEREGSLFTYKYINKYLKEKNKGYPVRLDFLEDDLQDFVYMIANRKLHWFFEKKKNT